MTEGKEHVDFKVSIEETPGGECVRLSWGEEGRSLCLSPQEARALASELIQMVYQAEVKASLKKTRGGENPPAVQRVVEGRFPPLRPARAPQ